MYPKEKVHIFGDVPDDMQVTAPSSLSHPQTKKNRISLAAAAVPIALTLLGSASLALYIWGRDLHRFTQWIAAYIGLFIAQLALYLIACYAVQRWSDRASGAVKWITIALILLFGIASRAVLVAQRPYLSSDVYRYAWDGRVQAAGINPYRYVPEARELAWLRDDTIYPNINREDRNWTSPYPPVAQAIFASVASMRPQSVTALKAVVSLFDILSTIVLMLVLGRSNIDPARAILFAWHPLVIFETAHSGHIDGVYVTFLTLGLLAWTYKKGALTGGALALATLVKFYPALVLPAFILIDPQLQESGKFLDKWTSYIRRLINRHNLTLLAAFCITILIAYLPYAGAGRNLFAFLGGYIEEEGFVGSGSRYFFLSLLQRIVGFSPILLIVVVVLGVSYLVVRELVTEKLNASDVAQACLALIGAYLLLTTPRYAWYYLWLVPFISLAPRIGWLYLSAASVLLYLVWYTPMVYPQIPLWLGICIYIIALIWLLWDRFLDRTLRDLSCS